MLQVSAPTERSADLLTAAARAFLEDRLVPTATGTPDWDRLAWRAEHERLGPILFVTTAAGTAPPSAQARLRVAWIAATRQHLLAETQLRELLVAFDSAEIPAMVLKGPALAADYYPDPALRPFTDLDLLVRRGDRQRAIDVLAQLGYAHASPGRSLAYELAHAPAAYFGTSGDTSRLPVDLHWDCVAHPGGSRVADLAVDEIWARALRAQWGASASTLAPEDLVIYLAAHLAIHHACAGVLWHLDLALVLQRHGATLDWGDVVDRARRWGVAGAVYFALRVVGEEFGVTPTPSSMRALRPGNLRLSMVNRLLNRGPERSVQHEYVLGILLLDRVSDVVRAIVSGLIPAPGWLRLRYDSRSLLAGYIAHYRRLAGRLARATN